MKKIILDTNFLLIPGSVKVDIFAELERLCLFKYKVYVLDMTIKELEKLKAEGKGKTSKNAKLALDLLKIKKVNIIKTKQGHVDDLILQVADKDTIVATQDMELKRRLKAKGIPQIILRKKQYLDMVLT